MIFELRFILNCWPYILPVLAGPGRVLLLGAAGPVLGSGAGGGSDSDPGVGALTAPVRS
jgi:hypothetical protein